MKKTFLFFALFVVFMFPCEFFAGETELELFLSAIQNSANNHLIFRSVYAEFEEQYSQAGGQEEEVASRVARLMPKEASPNDRLRSKIHLERTFGKSQRTQRWEFLYSADKYGGKNRFSSVEYDVDHKAWLLNSYNIVHGDAWSGGRSAVLLPKTEAIVDDKASLPFQIQHFGRHDGFNARLLRTMLLRHSDEKEFKFSEEGKQAVKEYMNEQGWQFANAGPVTYDDGQIATVLEIRKGEIVVERYWIDTNRGYICPLVQCYLTGKEPAFERKASQYFLHKKSGLWYPEFFEAMNDMPHAFAGKTTQKFTLNKSTFKLNQPVSDEEFSIDIPEKMIVCDSRQGKGRTMKYIAMEKGTLSLSKGGLDLDKMDWLMREGDLHYGKKPSAAAQRTRVALMGLGVLFIATALVMKFRRRTGKKK